VVGLYSLWGGAVVKMKVASFSSASEMPHGHCQGGSPIRGTAVLGEHTRARVMLPERSEIFTTVGVGCENKIHIYLLM